MASPIRRRLFAALAGFTTLLCLGYTGLLLVVSYVTEDMLVDRLLAREAAALSAAYARDGQLAAPGLDLVRVYRSAAALPPPVRARVAAGHARGEIFAPDGAHYHLRTVHPAPGAAPVWLVADVGPILVVSRLFQEVGGLLLLVALGLVALALGLAWWLARRLVAPLLQLAHDVRTLPAQGRFAFAARRRGDEIGYLADKLGTALADLHAALARERAFTRDVSHELRTPLTVMKNALVAAPDAQALAQLRAGVDDLAATVDVLFALARAERLPLAPFDLRGCIEDSLLRQPGCADWDEGRLELRLPGRVPVTGHRQLAMVLLDNCIGNALHHGGPRCRLALSYEQGELAIVNSVGQEPNAAQGFRHGHDVLARVAAAMGWSVRFEPGGDSYRVAIAVTPAEAVSHRGVSHQNGTRTRP
ncbi:sensor histidine kinase [Pseudoduganella chitinolytica]|uniref:histidine kinase n=1 Tax=Pseudoduganella chitinolytica TaxID=34070 RepID=A0ABY8BF60_9BURK|nr:HAMP domain-containing sensor histidine kinase [Pseudoduganella chitinolytica]WEF34542.1 HAMP domain-containing sensor histidine kinase [Pseudoduganella chitinolytica]